MIITLLLYYVTHTDAIYMIFYIFSIYIHMTCNRKLKTNLIESKTVVRINYSK